jgi:prepilin-type N-terminal cleavage/methylation domain-containing protein
MRLETQSCGGCCRSGRLTERGFTLNELMVVSAIFLLVVAGVLVASLFGVRMIAFTEPKLVADQRARVWFNQVAEEIGSAWDVEVGTGDVGAFTPVPPGQPKAGNALQVYPGADTNEFIRYFLDSGAQELLRVTHEGGDPEILAQAVTNSVVFTGEDYTGRTLTNNRSSMVIGLLLEYAALEGTGMPLGPGELFKGHQVQGKFTWRSR